MRIVRVKKVPAAWYKRGVRRERLHAGRKEGGEKKELLPLTLPLKEQSGDDDTSPREERRLEGDVTKAAGKKKKTPVWKSDVMVNVHSSV